jgi:hemerythrin superfamily protein
MATPMKTEAPDAVTLLKKDHKEVKKLLDELEDAETGSERKALVERIEKELKVHSTIEEEIFYPAFKAAVEDDEDEALFFEAREEHGLVDEMLEKLGRGDHASAEYMARCKVLCDLVIHHADEEEGEMFPCAKKHMDKDQLDELGQRLQARKGELQAGAAPKSGGSRSKPAR